MGDEKKRPAKSLQKLLEHHEGLEVQIVGRFIQEHEIGLLADQIQQLGPHSVSTAERADLAGIFFVRKAQAPTERLEFPNGEGDSAR